MNANAVNALVQRGLAETLNINGQTVTIDGTDFVALSVTEILHEEIFVAGGYAEGGGFRVMIPQLDANGDPIAQPAQGAPIAVRGHLLQILSVRDRNRIIWEIQAGAVVAEDR